LPVSYYSDEKLTKPLTIKDGMPILEWGESVPGEKKEKTIYVKNETPDRLTFKESYCEDEDMKIESFPSNIQGNAFGVIKVQFQPESNRLKPLSSNWGFELVIG